MGRSWEPGSIQESCIGIFTGHSQVHSRSGIPTVRLSTRVENDVNVEGDEGGPTQASLGVQGLHVVNIADDSDEELSKTKSEHLETQSRPRRLRLTWRENQDVEWHRDVRLAECLVLDLASRIGPQLPGAQIPAVVRRQRWSLDCASCLGSCWSG